MALLDRDAGLLFTAAPGAGSTALREALLNQRAVTQVPPPGTVRLAGVDVKHGTERQLVTAGLIEPDHGLRVVTTTRNPFDFYVADHERSRSRWVHELREPTSWVYATPGAVDRIIDAVSLDFDAWLVQVVGDPSRPRRVNRAHVEEADVVLRMEHLETDLSDLLGLEVGVPRTNVTDRDRAYWRSYGLAGRALVEESHAEDLARFGYRF